MRETVADLGVVVPPGAGVLPHKVDGPAHQEPQQHHGEAGQSQDEPEWHRGGGGGGGDGGGCIT